MNIPSLLNSLLIKLNQENIAYCHWKSNVSLDDALLGKRDLDLYVDKNAASQFERIIAESGFKRAVGPSWDTHYPIYHYYGFDEETGKIIHLHAYYNIVTGGGLVKNYKLPVESLLISCSDKYINIRIPQKSAELVVFVLRKMIEQNILEFPFFLREHKSIIKELNWLCSAESEKNAIDILLKWIPEIDEQLFLKCISALKLRQYFRLSIYGWKIQKKLKYYKISSSSAVFLNHIYRLSRMLYQRFVVKEKTNKFFSGGAVIAFVGPEAVGKTTMISEMYKWIGQEFIAETIHAGKPPSSLLTFIPHLFLPLARRIFSKQRTSVVEMEDFQKQPDISKRLSWLFIIRSLTIGYDRLKLLNTSFRKACKGAIILCDRYPSPQIGAIDSAQLSKSPQQKKAVKNYFVDLENSFYKKIPKPDIVIFLSAPVEVVVSRNYNRFKKEGTEPEEMIRRRHAMMSNPIFPDTNVYIIDTNRPISEAIGDIKKAIWDTL